MIAGQRVKVEWSNVDKQVDFGRVLAWGLNQARSGGDGGWEALIAFDDGRVSAVSIVRVRVIPGGDDDDDADTTPADGPVLFTI